MAKRYLKVEVCREFSSEVYLAVDDADPRFAEIFDMTIVEPGMIADRLQKVFGFRLDNAAHAAAEREAENLDDLDWSETAITANWYANEVKAEDAEQFGVVDLTQGISSEQQPSDGQSGKGCESVLRHE